MGCGTIALEFGTALHAAMPHCYPDSKNDVRENTKKALAEFKKHWPAACEEENDEKRNLGRAHGILKHFCLTHIKGQRLYDIIPVPKAVGDITGRPSNEFPFVIDLGLDRPVVGWIDAFGKHVHTGALYPIDYKSCFEMSARFQKSLFMLPQGMMYTIVAIDQLGKDANVQGFAIEGIFVGKASYNNLCTFLEIQDFQYKWFLDWVTRVAADITACEKSGFWPRKMTGCNPYANFYQPGWTCDFSDVCRVRDWTSLIPVMHHAKESAFALDLVKAMRLEKKDDEETERKTSSCNSKA